MSERRPSVFGSRSRDRVLMLVAALGDVHVRGAARALGLSAGEVGRAAASLERIGVLSSRLVGTTRLLVLNRRWYAANELQTLVDRMLAFDPEIGAIAESTRTRPRRRG